MNFDYPTIRYGRRTEGNADFYDVLSQSPGFPDEAAALFRQQICQSVEWTGGGNEGEKYPDSFLFWKLPPGRILAAKLTDAGCDSRGRPHSVGMEAVLVETGSVDLSAAEFLARLMGTPDW